MHHDKKTYNEILDMPTDVRKRYIKFVNDIISKQGGNINPNDIK